MRADPNNFPTAVAGNHRWADVVVGRVDDQLFRASPIPDCAPLLAVCGSVGAAKDALMSIQKRLWPRRLDRRTDLDRLE